MVPWVPWVPITKISARLLPKDRPFTKLEALFSLQLDHNNKNEVSVMGMSKCWGWSRKRVRTFLDREGVEISYPESTVKRQNQRGLIRVQIRGQIRDRSPEKRGQINFIDYNMLQQGGDRSPEKRGQIRDRSGATTIENREKKKKNTAFSENAASKNGDFYLTSKGRKLSGWKLEAFLKFWDAFGYKKGKPDAAESWLSIPEINESLVCGIIKAAQAEARMRPSLLKNKSTPKMAQGWLTKRRWEDEYYETQADEPNRPQSRKLT